MEPKPIPYHDLKRALKPGAEAERQACPICFKHEIIGPEADAWLRSIEQVSGKRGIR